MKPVSKDDKRVKYFEEYGEEVEKFPDDGVDLEDTRWADWLADNVIPFKPVAKRVTMTFFKNQYAKSMTVERLTLEQLAERVMSKTARTKDDLPFVKLGIFSGAVNPANPKAGCLRCDATLEEISGIEGDKDDKPLSLDEAVAKLKTVKLRSMLYTSSSHTEAKPRFRVFCPTSRMLPKTERTKLMKRLNGVLGGALSGESFTLSQSYYFGYVKGKPAPIVHIIKGDYIDQRDDLDTGALGKNETTTLDDEIEAAVQREMDRPRLLRGGETEEQARKRVTATINARDHANYYEQYGAENAFKEPIDIDQALADMESGHEVHNIHNTQLSVIAALLNRGVRVDEAVAKVLARTMEVTLYPTEKTRKTQTKILRGMAESWLRKNPELKQNKTGTAASQRWGEPVDLWKKIEAPPLPKGLLPKVIEEFAFTQADLMGCDPAGLAMGGLTVCCAIIPDHIKIQVKKHDIRWKESARIWTAFAGPPSVVKSPIVDRVTEPLNRIDLELSRRYQEAMEAYQALESAEKKTAVRPSHERVRFEDVTPEAAQPILRDSPNGILLVRDELSGWFGSIDKYSGTRGGGMDRGFWLQAFNGKPYSWDRVVRGSGNIPNLSVCVLGGIQEEPLRKLVNDGVDDGLIQRLFIIMLRAAVLGRDEPLPEDQYDTLIEKLYALRRCFSEDRQFSDEAQKLRRQLEEQHLVLAKGYEKTNKRLAAHIGKYKGLFARLCLLWHTIETIDDNWPTFVDVDVAQRVAKFMNEFLLKHAVAFYVGLLGMSDQHDRLLAVAGYILAHKLDKLTTRDIQRGDRTMRDLEKRDTDRIFEQLEAFGWIEREMGRRYSDVTWKVNAEVHRLFAAKAAEEQERRQRERDEIRASLS